MMTREEILEKSRQENKNQDLVANEAAAKAVSVAMTAAIVLGTVLFLVQIICDGGANLALWAVDIFFIAVYYLVMFCKMRSRMHLLIAVLCSIMTLLLSTAHITSVINNSPALWSEEQMAEIIEVEE
ncbi:MAG: hypothetical protein E7504_07370 [Ruminococcus sp.]|nr:hypothetical protein [Ruminococcus sp.]